MRAVILPLALLVAASASAQAPKAAGEGSPAEVVRFLRTAWSKIRAEGPNAVNRLGKDWPEAIRRVEARAQALRSATLDGVDPLERVGLLAELWRVRGSVNLLAFLSPENLSIVTGLTPEELREVSRTVRTVESALGIKAPSPVKTGS